MCKSYDYETEDLSEYGDLRVEDLDDLLPEAERTEVDEERADREDREPVVPSADD